MKRFPVDSAPAAVLIVLSSIHPQGWVPVETLQPPVQDSPEDVDLW